METIVCKKKKSMNKINNVIIIIESKCIRKINSSGLFMDVYNLYNFYVRNFLGILYICIMTYYNKFNKYK